MLFLLFSPFSWERQCVLASWLTADNAVIRLSRAASTAWCASQKTLTAEADAKALAIYQADYLLERALFDHEAGGEFGYSFDLEEQEARDEGIKL